jgi:putative flavoprotein involved in K+ transport
MASKLPASIHQIDGAEYRYPEGLPDGGVMVVGCGDTGGQVAEELVLTGRRVYLSTGRNGRIPRRYRGRDIFLWMSESKLNTRPRQPGANRALVGRDHTITLQSLSARGVALLGRIRDVSGSGRVFLEDSLTESATFADELSAGVKSAIDDYIRREGIAAPDAEPDPEETIASRFPDPPILELDLNAAGITTVIWATGFRGNFDWLKVPGAVDDDGNPIQEKSVSVPGVYFAGLDSQEALRSGTVLVAGLEAERIVQHLRANC